MTPQNLYHKHLKSNPEAKAREACKRKHSSTENDLLVLTPKVFTWGHHVQYASQNEPRYPSKMEICEKFKFLVYQGRGLGARPRSVAPSPGLKQAPPPPPGEPGRHLGAAPPLLLPPSPLQLRVLLLLLHGGCSQTKPGAMPRPQPSSIGAERGGGRRRGPRRRRRSRGGASRGRRHRHRHSPPGAAGGCGRAAAPPPPDLGSPLTAPGVQRAKKGVKAAGWVPSAPPRGSPLALRAGGAAAGE